jgi:glycosyltransferase involved in cell wall biosynthesis
MSKGVTAHMVVKNEDRWVYFAINSVLPYVDTFLITDTGSTDHTVSLIKSINSPKIVFTKVHVKTRADLSAVRQSQINQTQTDWIWIVDGDEIYPDALSSEITSAIADKSKSIIVVRRYDLLGDVYHKQLESVGSYQMYGHTGHLLVRLINKTKLGSLTVSGDYPLESYYTQDGTKVNDLPAKDVYITNHALYHAMYLKRSSLGRNLSMFNRGKYKYERGMKIDSKPPEVFSQDYPRSLPSPLAPRGLAYELLASILTPLKQLKRKFL